MNMRWHRKLVLTDPHFSATEAIVSGRIEGATLLRRIVLREEFCINHALFSSCFWIIAALLNPINSVAADIVDPHYFDFLINRQIEHRTRCGTYHLRILACSIPLASQSTIVKAHLACSVSSVCCCINGCCLNVPRLHIYYIKTVTIGRLHFLFLASKVLLVVLVDWWWVDGTVDMEPEVCVDELHELVGFGVTADDNQID